MLMETNYFFFRICCMGGIINELIFVEKLRKKGKRILADRMVVCRRWNVLNLAKRKRLKSD